MSAQESRQIPMTSIKPTLKITLSAMFIAVGTLLSYVNPFKDVLLFGAKINPFVHLINAISGVILGPVYAVIIAVTIASIRFSMSWGTILAFPGGISGALVVGLVSKVLKNKYKKIAALTEPIGTVFIGATISAYILQTKVLSLWILFALSSIVGAILGFILLAIILLKESSIKTLIET